MTSKEIRERMGCSTIVFPGDRRLGGPELAEIKAAGLSRIEVGGYMQPAHYNFQDKAQREELAQEAEKQGIEIVSVHCPALPFGSHHYPGIRDAVIDTQTAAVRSAAELGAPIFVCHVGMKEPEMDIFRETVRRTDDVDIRFVVETGSIPKIMEFIEEFDPARVGIVVDIGHLKDADKRNPVTIPGRTAEVLTACGDRLLHVHLHDFCDGRDHYPPFDGEVCWDEVIGTLEAMNYSGAIMFEPVGIESTEDTLAKLGAFPEEFERRYA